MSQIYSISLIVLVFTTVVLSLAVVHYYRQDRDTYAMYLQACEVGEFHYAMFQDANDALAEACADLHAAQYEVEELKSLVDRVWRGQYDMPDCEYIAQIAESAARRRHPSYTEDVPF